MNKTVSFRDFEERDIDFVFKCKNDAELNSMIVGNYHPFSYGEAEKWVHGCMGEHETYKFWAVCTNDDEQRIVGWVSLSQIDKKNRSACSHGIVIGDPEYRNGLAWVESILFVNEYVFEVLKFNRIYGTCRADHKLSVQLGPALFKKQEGYFREALFCDGKFVDIIYSSLLAREYFEHKEKGEYEVESVVRRLVKSRKNNSNK